MRRHRPGCPPRAPRAPRPSLHSPDEPGQNRSDPEDDGEHRAFVGVDERRSDAENEEGKSPHEDDVGQPLVATEAQSGQRESARSQQHEHALGRSHEQGLKGELKVEQRNNDEQADATEVGIFG